MVVIWSVPCKLASEVHVNGQRVGETEIAHTHGGDVMAHRA
jgi:hypothetical protein